VGKGGRYVLSLGEATNCYLEGGTVLALKPFG
jgi:hypothetical protein